ncbi:MAG: UDP-glucose--hexose-1-phosphate uridylyltransferase [Ruminococcus sp.]|nr:UDP-glucose--hexose-1-phosphate uridylyltransferase [Ruminococcus sp.]
MIYESIKKLVTYALEKGLIEPLDRVWATNRILEALCLDEYEEPDEVFENIDLESTLAEILEYAVGKGLCENSTVCRDLFDTKLMGLLTPPPSAVNKRFEELYAQSPEAATDYFYRFSRDTDYIRTYRVAKDMRWKTATEYGDLDITINLSKPEKDPKAIAAAKNAKQSGYPKCQLCRECEGYAGRVDYPARQNHRIAAIEISGEDWGFQYSPYVYYNEHCIVFNKRHTPMMIDKGAFDKLLGFVTKFPHYFVGSNADLPIVGGSILAHEHFQGGRYVFPMEKAPVETELDFKGFGDVSAGIVRWAMSVIRLRGSDPERISLLAEKILAAWRGYTDEEAFIFAETEGEPHNTVTPIARRRGSDYELDLVLRNNITTEEHPLGVYHPHAELHHIKKENIGLIEVMGLAVLPSRLKSELSALGKAMVSGDEISADPLIAKHAAWADEIRSRHTSLNADNIDEILRSETGQIFAKVLEHAGVFKRTDEGRAAFMRFAEYVDGGL